MEGLRSFFRHDVMICGRSLEEGCVSASGILRAKRYLDPRRHAGGAREDAIEPSGWNRSEFRRIILTELIDFLCQEDEWSK
jgi:hypothetical protein